MFDVISIDLPRFPLEILASILLADAVLLASLVGIDTAFRRRTHTRAR